MYAIEFRFAVERDGAVPRPEILEESFRRNGDRQDGRIEHLRVHLGLCEVHVVVFASANHLSAARRFARSLGEAVAAELEGIRLRRFRIWE